MSDPLVSVIIPTYKSNETLLRAIDSILNQTYDNFEVIVVDDNNPDTDERKNTEALMKKYETDSRVKYIQHERNKNGSAARNTAFRNSDGEYISFLDDDDYYHPDNLKKQVEYLQKHLDVGGCYCWRKQNDKEVCGKYKGNLTKEILSLEFTPYTSAIMIRRNCYEKLNGFDESYRRHQDFEFLLRYFDYFTLDYNPEVLVTISTNGVNNQPKGKKFVEVKEHFFTQFADKILEIKKTDRETWKKIYLNHFVRMFKDLLRYGHPLLAIKIYFKYGIMLGGDFWKLFYKLCKAGQLERMGRR